MDERLIKQAVEIRFLIVANGGMATKSVVEDVLMARHAGLGRTEAHDILNHIEYHNIGQPDDLPELADYPEILDAGAKWQPQAGVVVAVSRQGDQHFVHLLTGTMDFPRYGNRHGHARPHIAVVEVTAAAAKVAKDINIARATDFTEWANDDWRIDFRPVR